MPWIERVRTEQPLDAGVGIDEAFAGKLLDGFVGAAGLTLKGKVITDTANISKAASALGTSRRGAANAGFSFPSDLTSANSITVVCQFVQYARTGAQLLIEHSANSNSNVGTFLLYTDATAGGLILNTSASSNYDAAYVALPALGSVITVAMRLRFTASSTATDDLGIWINGVAPTLTGFASTSATYNFGNFTTYFLSRAASSLQADAAIGMYAVLSGFASDTDLKSLSINPWQLFEKERIWVPAGAAGGSTVTQADGTSTAGTLGGSASAASTPTAADGTSTAASITASATAAAGVASADGTSTASTLTGSAVNAAAITQADGVSTAATLTGTGLADGAAGITPAAGTSTTETLAGSSAAVSSFESAAGASAVSVLGGASLWEGAFSAAAGVSTCSSLVGSDATIVITPGYPDPSTVLVGISYGPTGVEYTGTFTVPSAASIAVQVRTELAAELLRITEVAKIHGLVQGTDLVVTPTSRVAGDISQTISGDGVSSSTVSRV